jgi:predicted ATPase with chaperone activity
MPAHAVADPVPPPLEPATLEESGLNPDLLMQLLLKTMHFAGELSGLDLASRLGLRFSVIEDVLQGLKDRHHCEIAGGSFLGGGSFRYRITDAGRTRAGLFLEHSHYVGIAPVPLAHYQRYMRTFAERAPRSATRERVREAFSHLVVADPVLDQIGPAVNSRHSMFVYGPPGNGKTIISQSLRTLLDGELYVPHALEVEGSIIRLFDPVNHEPVPDDGTPAHLDLGLRCDARWVRCRRPLVTAGGELTLRQLELTYSPVTGFYNAPIQAVANGGVLVIDDFGRQHCRPRDLLNRWIVPLESRVDYLTLQTGQKFELPFTALVVFATNIKPAELVDEAFLRRVHYKVFAESPTPGEFTQIFRNYCEAQGLAFDRALVEDLLAGYLAPRGIALRGCQPRDLINQALALAEYRGEPRRLTSELLARACASYFIDESEAGANGLSSAGH